MLLETDMQTNSYNPTSHATGAVIVKIKGDGNFQQNGVINVLAYSYAKTSPTGWETRNPFRLVMETGKVGESLLGTLTRGGYEELNNCYDTEVFKIKLVAAKPVFVTIVESDDKIGEHHLKAIYLAVGSGPIRNYKLDSHGEKLGKPEWSEIGWLINRMLRENEEIYTHRQALINSVHVLSKIFPSVERRYEYLLEIYPFRYLSIHKKIMTDYIKKGRTSFETAR